MAYRAVVIATSDYSELDFLVITQSRPKVAVPDKEKVARMLPIRRNGPNGHSVEHSPIRGNH